MNQGQEQFFNFIMERVREDKVEEAKALLADNFKKQAEGTFTQEDITQTISKMLTLLKSEKVEEVQAVMKQFAGSFQSIRPTKRATLQSIQGCFFMSKLIYSLLKKGLNSALKP